MTSTYSPVNATIASPPVNKMLLKIVP